MVWVYGLVFQDFQNLHLRDPKNLYDRSESAELVSAFSRSREIMCIVSYHRISTRHPVVSVDSGATHEGVRTSCCFALELEGAAGRRIV